MKFLLDYGLYKHVYKCTCTKNIIQKSIPFGICYSEELKVIYSIKQIDNCTCEKVSLLLVTPYGIYDGKTKTNELQLLPSKLIDSLIQLYLMSPKRFYYNLKNFFKSASKSKLFSKSDTVQTIYGNVTYDYVDDASIDREYYYKLATMIFPYLKLNR